MRMSTRLPYQDWFNEQCYHTLGSLKGAFFADIQDIELSPTFKDFLLWLQVLQYYFSAGFKLKPSIIPNLPDGIKLATAQFNNETLGGHITLSHMRITSWIFEVITNIPTPEPSWQAEDQKDKIR